MIKQVAQISAGVSAVAGGSWMAFHSPEEWASEASKAMDAGIAICYAVLNKLPSIEALAYVLFAHLVRLFS